MHPEGREVRRGLDTTSFDSYDELKRYEELEFRDDFMFGVVMSDLSIAKRVISVILADEIPDIINALDRKKAGPTAIPDGLYLNRVIY